MKRLLFIATLLSATAVASLAQRVDWKPSDFAPLMEVPWEKDNAAMKDVLQTIFREPDPEIRYAALAGYLEMIPVGHLDEAFEVSVNLEGCQEPNEMVSLFLAIWGRRDPEVAWKKARALFDVTVIDGDPLSLDSWSNPPLQVADLAALRASPIWLSSWFNPIDGLAEGVQAADLPLPLKTRLLKEISNLVLDRLGRLPCQQPVNGQHQATSWELCRVFKTSLPELGDLVRYRGYGAGSAGFQPATIRAGLVRWLCLKPQDAIKILDVTKQIEWPAEVKMTAADQRVPSLDFLMQWARLDLPAMIRWTEAQGIRDGFVGIEARGLLMSRVDGTTRKRWLREARGAKDDDDLRAKLLEQWAQWDPVEALKAAVETRDPEAIYDSAHGAVYTSAGAWNSSLHGLGVLREYDLYAATAALPEDSRDYCVGELATTIMEQWIDIDVGEAARYGFSFLTKSGANWIPRKDLVKLFSGDDEFSRDGDMVDRTFCALRFWAFWKPDEMRQWIATVEDAEMRKALTWLLEHPMYEIKKKGAEESKP
jgi:hypothetical protein